MCKIETAKLVYTRKLQGARAQSPVANDANGVARVRQFCSLASQTRGTKPAVNRQVVRRHANTIRTGLSRLDATHSELRRDVTGTCP